MLQPLSSEKERKSSSPRKTYNTHSKSKRNIKKRKPTGEKSPQQKVKWVTRSMAENFSREDILSAAFIETLMQTVFYVAILVWVFQNSNRLVYRVSDSMVDLFTKSKFRTINDVPIEYDDIRAPSDFWQYVDEILLQSLYWNFTTGLNINPDEPTGDDKKIFYMNQMLGVARIRQVKVHNESCYIHQFFRRTFTNCFNMFTVKSEDQVPFGLKNGTAWVYTPQNVTQNFPVTGEISTYGGGGYYVDLPVDLDQARTMMKDLKENVWITRGTRAILIDFSIYNANVNLFCVCKLILEFPPTGGIMPSHRFRSFQLLVGEDTKFYIIWVCKGVVYMLIFVSICEEIREMVYEKINYIIQFWNYIDLIIIAIVVGQIICAIQLRKLDQVVNHIVSHPEEYGNLEYIKNVKVLENHFVSGVFFFSSVKWFKYLSINEVMGQLNNTLKKSSKDVLRFLLMFLIIFFAYAGLGYILFQNMRFRTFSMTCVYLICVILGDVKYKSFEQTNEILAPFYFTSYIVIVYFVLVNVFLAIINDTYNEVKMKIALEPEEVHITDYVKKMIVHWLHKCGFRFHHVEEKAIFKRNIKKILRVFKLSGFTDKKIEEFLNRCDIDLSKPIDEVLIQKTIQSLETHADMDIEDEENELYLEDFKQEQTRIETIENKIAEIVSKTNFTLNKLKEINENRRADEMWTDIVA